ncbi:MAG: D-glycero-beta-D-manno-heptose 1-phosphate adenylyltransferase [Bacteroidales bacterium]|jgi:rfaE bifunctional protein nucleotidyltransferase chain/domain|nr:D-glycero-beta-D-manno-heptose 1-phosphate adenylyltransferase [Bacteroidales bacterium]
MKFPIQEKIITRSQFETLKPSLSDQKIVFTNGCFDIIHLGHIQYLAQARELGDLLVVGLNTDLSVKRLKGESRPVNPEFARAIVLAALQFVDFVILFDEDTPLNLIHTISPDFLVKGGDYSIDQIVGADFVIKKGGKVITLPFVEGFSSSNIIQNTNP